MTAAAARAARPCGLDLGGRDSRDGPVALIGLLYRYLRHGFDAVR